jgi:hypothetical protein
MLAPREAQDAGRVFGAEEALSFLLFRGTTIALAAVLLGAVFGRGVLGNGFWLDLGIDAGWRRGCWSVDVQEAVARRCLDGRLVHGVGVDDGDVVVYRAKRRHDVCFTGGNEDRVARAGWGDGSEVFLETRIL